MVKTTLRNLRKNKPKQISVENQDEERQATAENSKQVSDREREKKIIDYSSIATEIYDEIYLDPNDIQAFMVALNDFMLNWQK